MRTVFSAAFSVVALLAISLLGGTAHAEPFFFTGETCATRPSEVASMRDVQETLQLFGGLDAVIGSYKLGGLIGDIKKIRVQLESTPEGFTSRVNKDDVKQVWLCADPRDAGVLHLKVINSALPENSLILVKPGTDGSSIYLASAGSKWKYYRFKRLDSMKRLAIN